MSNRTITCMQLMEETKQRRRSLKQYCIVGMILLIWIVLVWRIVVNSPWKFAKLFHRQILLLYFAIWYNGGQLCLREPSRTRAITERQGEDVGGEEDIGDIEPMLKSCPMMTMQAFFFFPSDGLLRECEG